MSEISEIIKRLRAAPSSLSQSEIARRTGMSQPQVSRWESGEVAAGAANDALRLVALAKEMGVYDNQPPTPREDDRRHIEIAPVVIIQDRRGLVPLARPKNAKRRQSKRRSK